MSTPPLDVLLVQPQQGDYTRNQIFQPGVEIPLNLACLAGYLDRERVTNRILDLRLEPHERVLELVESERPRIVGITAFTSEISNAVKIADEIRERTRDPLVVIGGYHATAEPIETLKMTPSFDYLVHGEGEVSFTGLVKAYFEGRPIEPLAGVAYRADGEIVSNERPPLVDDLDTLPLTPRHKLDMPHYRPSPGTGNFLRLPSTGIMASRGCPYTCRYCSKGAWGVTTRFRSVEHILGEIEQCIADYGIHDFRFYDDILPLKKKWMFAFCDEVARRDLDISWNCYSRVDLTNLELLEAMARAGCYHIKYGIEFGTDMSMDHANKGTSIEQAREAVRLTKQVGIEAKGNFIVGVPGEPVEFARETIKFAIDISPDLAAFYPYYPAPGSEWGNRFRDDPEFAASLLPEPVRQGLAREAYVKFYLRPSYVLQRLKRLVRYPARDLRVISNALKMMGTYFARQVMARYRQPHLTPP